jgi:membrane protein implicated in regulation of membrane protease activity
MKVLKGIGFAMLIIIFIIAIPVLSILTIRTETETATETDNPIVKTRIIEATVYGKDTEGTNVLFCGSDGNLWSADCETEMYKGQQVMIELSNNGTAMIEDDEIVNVWLTH